MTTEIRKKVYVAEIVKFGKEITIPEDMTYDVAIKTLMRQRDYEEQTMVLTETFEEAFYLDAAYALNKALGRTYGWVEGITIPATWFTPAEHPTMVQIDVDWKKKVSIPWGRFRVPPVEGIIETSSIQKEKGGRVYFQAQATIKRKYEDQMQEVFDLARHILETESIYRGKAIKIRFNKDDETVLPVPALRFINLAGVENQSIVFSRLLEGSIEANLYSPIENSELCREHGVPLKRGVLLAGPYGCGKTLLAHKTALKAVNNKWTFVYAERASEIAECVELAQLYQPAVLFCEDIDREVGGQRDEKMDRIFNVVDGIDSKHTEVIVILTTNHVESIQQGMLRPGRLDAVINIEPPDAEAVMRLFRTYAGNLISDLEDLEEPARLMAGQIPATIRECVERAKLDAIYRMGKVGEKELHLTASDLTQSAFTMQMQIKLLEPKAADARTDFEKLGYIIGEKIHEGIVDFDLRESINRAVAVTRENEKNKGNSQPKQ